MGITFPSAAILLASGVLVQQGHLGPKGAYFAYRWVISHRSQ
jgi:hypothetical protein